MPVERFSESISEILSSAFSTSAAIRSTFSEFDMLPEIEKQMISSPASRMGLKNSMTSSTEDAAVCGVVLFWSAQAKMVSSSTFTPSRRSCSPKRTCRGRMVR